MTAIKDSGKRRSFEGGAVRDAAEGKPRYSLVPPKAFERWTMHLTKGADKYDDHNWTKGMPTSVILDSLMRHVEALRRGDTDEDHAAAAMCNISFFIQFEGTEWDDRHDWSVPPREPEKQTAVEVAIAAGELNENARKWGPATTTFFERHFVAAQGEVEEIIGDVVVVERTEIASTITVPDIGGRDV